MTWAVIAGTVVIVLALCFYLVVFTDGTYLGPRFVRFVYDRLGRRWDYPTNARHQRIDQMDLAPVLRDALAAQLAGVVLDVASGTGRVPLLLLGQPEWFAGTVVGADVSAGMLAAGAARVRRASASSPATAMLVQAAAERLPVRDGCAAAVTCIEALVNFGRPRRALAEMVRVLSPGGAIVVTKRSDALARLTPGKDFTRRRLARTLHQLGCAGELSYSPYRGSVGRSEVAVARKLVSSSRVSP